MPRIAKDHPDSANLTEFVNFRLNKYYHDRLRKEAEKTNSYMNTLARKAVIKYLDDINKKEAKGEIWIESPK